MNAHTQHTSLFAVHQHLLRERLLSLLSPLHPLLYTDVILALKEPGKLLSPSPLEANITDPPLSAGVWSLLTLLIAQHVSPDIDLHYASSVAVGTECFLCALDLLDDVEDDDQTSVIQTLGSARTLNVSTALLAIAQRAILSVSQYDVSSSRIVYLLDTMQEMLVAATNGQHRDILAEQRNEQEFTPEECIEIAAGKAGSLMRLACLLGAICAGADKPVYEEFSELGDALGIAHQLDNDCHDLYHLLYNGTSVIQPSGIEAFAGSRKTDLTREKKTLPIILAAKRGYSLQKFLSPIDEEGKKECLLALQEGIISSWGISLLYRERARESLQKIETRRQVSPALSLLLNLT